jgi:hypothetical protein
MALSLVHLVPPLADLVPPLAHFGHWYISLPVFMGPVVALFAYIYIGEWRNKRKERRKSGK